MSRQRWFCETILAPLILLVIIGLCWEGAIWWWDIKAFLLPHTYDVGKAAWLGREELLTAMGYTLAAAVTGFVCSLLGGSLISMLFAQSRWIRSAGYPYAIFLQTVPIVAIAPLLIVTCGQNFRTIILIAFIISLFPIITNVTAGLLAVDPKLYELFAVLRATRWQKMWKLQFPTALPYLITGAKTSSGLAMVGAIVGEFYAGGGQGRGGLGRLIYATSDALRTNKLIAAVLATALLGIAIFSIVNFIAWLLRRWTAAT